uniref:Retrovirus-related Pol polyprotein from transposon TNT 1-94 n=1 Tax=Tanacetum cinerariifolium TaxID=118510 RepID=A0A6L2KBU5_TANCI|nr:retrovirus-related Pol polyprotein from transposon TNT 1-94 [Tanacetum cinerariifolium]
MFDANHDVCFLDFVNDVNVRSKSKSDNQNQQHNIWKPTGKVFTKVGYKWKPTGNFFTIVGNSCPLTRMTPTKVVHLKETTSNSVETQKPKMKVYSMRSKQTKTVGLSKKAKIVESKIANNSKPNHSWGSNATDITSSSSLANDRLSRFFSGTVQFRNDQITKIMSYGDYQLGNVKFMRSKDEAPDAIIKCIKNIQVRLNAIVRNVRTDNGTDFVNHTLRKFYENIDITHQTSIACTPQLNGVVKRQNWTLVEAARTMLIFSKAPLFLWAEPINTACYTQNRSLIHLRYNKTPYELMHDKKSDLSFLHVFGSLCYLTNDSKDLGKLNAKTDIVPVSIAATPLSTTIDQDAPSSSSSLTNQQQQSSIISQGVEEPILNAHFDDPCHEPLHDVFTLKESSSNLQSSHSPLELIGKWTKDHPLANLIGNLSRSVSTIK